MTVFELGGAGESRPFHAMELGPRDAQPLVWLHGFPDHPPTALPFLEHLTRSRRVIAPWLRGYAPSPLDGPFDIDTLAADIIALIDKLGGKVDLVGHDWGAAITYAVCAKSPERVRRAATLALPHPLTFLRALKTGAQMRRSWYMALFQIPHSERLVRANDLAMVDHLWRTWSPNFELDDLRRAALHTCLSASLPSPLGYYRAMVRPLSQFRGRVQKLTGPIATPVLQLHGEGDGCILPPTDEDARRFTERRLELLPNLGHFLHLESPSGVAERITAWLA